MLVSQWCRLTKAGAQTEQTCVAAMTSVRASLHVAALSLHYVEQFALRQLETLFEYPYPSRKEYISLEA